MLRTVALAAALAAWTHSGVASANLLANGDFDSDFAPWADPFPDPTVTVSWSAIDAWGSPTSGSLQVQTNESNGASDGPVSECLPAEPGPYTFSGSVFRPNAAALPLVSLGIEFFPSPECMGAFADVLALASEVDAWERVTVMGVAPLGTSAVRARVLVGGTYDTIADVARFDRLVLRAPEPGAEALAAAAALTLALRAGWLRRARARAHHA